MVTAELPAYRPDSMRPPTERSLYAAPRPPGKLRRRDPAPIVVRFVVWFLALVCLLALVALVTVHDHPDWLSFLRKTYPSASATTAPPAGSAVTNAPSHSSSGTAAGLTFVSRQGTTYTYAVAAVSISITVDPISDAYVTVKSPPSSSSYAFADVVTKAKLTLIKVHAPAAVVVARQSLSIEIKSGTKVLGTVSNPKVGATYIFMTSKG